jgi:pimeloyl-ACP methyl ester carboxylesterase
MSKQKMSLRYWRWLLPGIALVAGCQSPTARNDRLAEAQGATRTVLAGAPFRHVLYHQPLHAPARIHVYIDGDGTPWIGGREPAADPTPRRPLALSLMAQDPSPTVYLGRPCYHGLARDEGCNARWWTFERYGPDVVASMAAALARLLEPYPDAGVALIGYSGGGVLALLVAERMTRVDTVVTVASNLDIAAWTAAHGYLPLSGSVNPALLDEWRSDLRQIHLAGGRDRVVPLHVTRSFTDRVNGAELHLFEHFGHVCCWADEWPAVLQSIYADAADRVTRARGPGAAAR